MYCQYVLVPDVGNSVGMYMKIHIYTLVEVRRTGVVLAIAHLSKLKNVPQP